MQLRHLFWRSVPIDNSPCSITITRKDETVMKRLQAMLDVAKMFPRVLPNGNPAKDCDAVLWLLSNLPMLEKLAGTWSVPADSSEFSK
jgi:hypothetical protein